MLKECRTWKKGIAFSCQAFRLKINGKKEREKGDKKKGEIEEAELRALIEQSMCGRLLLLVVLHGIMVDNIPRVERCKRTYCYGLRLQF